MRITVRKTMAPLLSSLWTAVLASFVCIAQVAAAYRPNPSSRTTSSRYFTEHKGLPPVPVLAETHAPCYNQLDTLPLVYTNNPRTVSQWLSENVPSEGSTVLGFDVEVSRANHGWLIV